MIALLDCRNFVADQLPSKVFEKLVKYTGGNCCPDYPSSHYYYSIRKFSINYKVCLGGGWTTK